LANVNSSRDALISEQEMVLKDLTGTEEEITSLNRKMELIKNKKMSDILDQQAAIEKTEADLAEEEIQLLEEGTGTAGQPGAMSPDTSSNELQSLKRLGDQLDSLNDQIKEEKTAIASARKELSEKKSEAAMQRARFGRTMGALVIFIVLGGILLLTFFYYLGKRSRRS
jgi:hypothetical protein